MEKVAEKRNSSDVSAKARKAYPNLTDEDLNFEEGKENEMIDRVQKKIGKSREETATWLKSLQSNTSNADHMSSNNTDHKSASNSNHMPSGDKKQEEPMHSKSAYKSEE